MVEAAKEVKAAPVIELPKPGDAIERQQKTETAYSKAEESPSSGISEMDWASSMASAEESVSGSLTMPAGENAQALEGAAASLPADSQEFLANKEKIPAEVRQRLDHLLRADFKYLRKVEPDELKK